MSLHIVATLADPLTGLMIAGSAVGSETLASPSTISGVGLIPADGRKYVLHLTAEVKMYYAIAAGTEPNVNINPRHLLLAGETMLLAAPAGTRVVWIAKA